MWRLEALLASEGTTKVEKAASGLAKAVRDFVREPTRGHLDAIRSAMDRAETCVDGFAEHDTRELLAATKQLLSIYGRRAVYLSNNHDAATRERAVAFLQEVGDIAEKVFRELEAVNSTASA